MAAPIHRDTALCLYASLGPRLLRGTQGLCFEYTDWQVFLDGCSDNPDEFTDTVTSYIQFCEETIIPTKTVSIFPNNKPWISKELKSILSGNR